MQTSKGDLILFVLLITAFVLLLATIIISLLYAYQKKQLKFRTDILNLKIGFENSLLQTQVEVQEQTFQHISREIHDNINLSITLAKLNLNMLEWDNMVKTRASVDQSIDLLSDAIRDLSNLSKSIDTNIITELGMINAIENEIKRLSNIAQLKIDFIIRGEPVFLDSGKELVIFRIIQEAFNNIIKHSKANLIELVLTYCSEEVSVIIKDNGIGFDKSFYIEKRYQRQGLRNMESRAKLLGGRFVLESLIGEGTTIQLTIPNQNDTKHQNSPGG